MGKLPKYKITIDDEYATNGEDLGIEQIAFTSNPAILVKGMAFSAATKTIKKAFSDDLKYRIAAPALIPMDIYRNDEDGEYFVQFTAEEIEKIHCKFMKDLSNRNLFNLEHDNAQTVPAYILECWLVENPKEDKSYTSFGIECPKGTLFVVSQLTDKEYYTKLVADDQVGYSIEGFLGLKMSDLINKAKNNNLTQMKKKLFSKSERPKFKMAKIADISVWNIDIDQDTFDVGTVLTSTWTDSSGKAYTNPISDGQYYTEDGSSIFVDVTGKVVLVQPATEAATPAQEPAVASTEMAADTPPAAEKKDEVAPVAAAETPAADNGESAADASTETPADETPAEDAGEEAKIDEAQILAILQPKLDEVYKMIADLKAQIAKTADTGDATPKTEMSAHQKFAALLTAASTGE